MKLLLVLPLVPPIFLTACAASDPNPDDTFDAGECRPYGAQVDASECALGERYFGCTKGLAPDAGDCEAVSAERILGEVVVGFCCAS